MSRRSSLGERGASALEYVGAMVLSALLVGALWISVAGSDNRVSKAVCQAVHTILHDSAACGTGEGGAMTDEDYEPDKCKYNEKGESFNSKVKIFFVEIGDNAGFVETVYSDGTVELTATDGGSVGVTGGFGADASFGKLSAGAKVNFGAGVQVDYGSTWRFEGKDGQKNADAFKKGLNEYLAQQESMKYGGFCLWWCKDAPRDPDTTTSSIKVTGDVSGTLGIDLTNKTGEGDDAAGQSIPAAEVVGKIGADSKWAVTTDNATGNQTYTTALSLNSSVSSQLWTATWGTAATNGVTMSITKDKDGKVTNIKFVSTAEGSTNTGGKAGGKTEQGKNSGGGSAGSSSADSTATVLTTSLDIDPNDDAAQQTVSNWLGGDTNYSWAGAMAAGSIDPAQADPDDPFQQLLHDQAKVSAVTYDNVKDIDQFGLNVKVGVALGFDFSLEKSESQAVAASYLGAPDAGGTRHPVPYTDCVS